MIENVEPLSWLYVARRWPQIPSYKRLPNFPDEGFEDLFRKFLYPKVGFDVVSVARDMSLGLSWTSLSGMPHELDSICMKGKDICAFELKHYKVSELTKEIVFTFLGKVLDFYLKNSIYLQDHRITMYLVTDNENIDDQIRRLCLAFGIKLIDPKLMTLQALEFFLRDMYAKTPPSETDLRTGVDSLVVNVTKLRETYDFAFSDIFRFSAGKIEIDALAIGVLQPSLGILEVKKANELFYQTKQKWDLATKDSPTQVKSVTS